MTKFSTGHREMTKHHILMRSINLASSADGSISAVYQSYLDTENKLILNLLPLIAAKTTSLTCRVNSGCQLPILFGGNIFSIGSTESNSLLTPFDVEVAICSPADKMAMRSLPRVTKQWNLVCTDTVKYMQAVVLTIGCLAS